MKIGGKILATAAFCVVLAPSTGHAQGWNDPYGASDGQQPYTQQPYRQQPYQPIPNPGAQELQQDMQALQRSEQLQDQEREEREAPPMQIQIVPPPSEP